MSSVRFFFLAFVLGLAVACGGGGSPIGGVDGGVGNDAASALDAGTDAEAEGDADVATDAGPDAEVEGDAGLVDAGLVDAGLVDAGADAAVDSGVCPPAVLTCAADAATVVRGASVELTAELATECAPTVVEWTVVSAPDGSAAAIAEPDEPTTRFVADVLGVYELRVRATDARGGVASCDVRVLATFPDTPCSGGVGDVAIERSIQPGLPRLAWSGEDYLFAFYGRPMADEALECSVGRLDASGAVSASPQLVSPRDGEISAWIRVARSDIGWGVTYVDDRGPRRAAYFARLRGDGTLVSGSERLISDPSQTVGDVTLAWNADDRIHGIVWTVGGDLHYRAVDAEGELLEAVPGTRVGAGSFDTTGTPLVWANDRFALVSAAPLRITEILRDGTVTRHQTLATGGARPSIAFDGTSRYGIVWQVGGAVRFVRVDATGIVGSELTLDAGPSAGEADIAWSGTEFGVTWDKGSVSVPSVVHFARVSPSGVVSGSRALTSGSSHDWWPSLTWCGQFAVAYVRGITPVNGEGELRLVFP